MKKKGFTLIELIIAIAIIAILAFVIKGVVGGGIHLPHIDLNLAFVIVIVIFIVVAYFVINTEIGWDPLIALILAGVALFLCMAFISGYAEEKSKEYSKGEITQLMWKSTTTISYEYNGKTYSRTEELSGNDQEVLKPQYELATYETAETKTEYYVIIEETNGFATIYSISELNWKNLWDEVKLGGEISYRSKVQNNENRINDMIW